MGRRAANTVSQCRQSERVYLSDCVSNGFARMMSLFSWAESQETGLAVTTIDVKRNPRGRTSTFAHLRFPSGLRAPVGSLGWECREPNRLREPDHHRLWREKGRILGSAVGTRWSPHSHTTDLVSGTGKVRWGEVISIDWSADEQGLTFSKEGQRAFVEETTPMLRLGE